MAGFVFSVIGFYVFREGKRKINYSLVFIGIALMLYSYFTHGPWQDWGIGVALCGAAKYFWD